MGIFLDTSFLIAFYNSSDTHHDTAVRLIPRVRNGEFGKVYTSTYVLDEFFTYVQRKLGTKEAYQLVQAWINDRKGIAEIITIGWPSFYQAAQLFLRQDDQRRPLSFTDCTIVQTCQEKQIGHLATFDVGFEGYLEVIGEPN